MRSNISQQTRVAKQDHSHNRRPTRRQTCRSLTTSEGVPSVVILVILVFWGGHKTSFDRPRPRLFFFLSTTTPLLSFLHNFHHHALRNSRSACLTRLFNPYLNSSKPSSKVDVKLHHHHEGSRDLPHCPSGLGVYHHRPGLSS